MRCGLVQRQLTGGHLSGIGHQVIICSSPQLTSVLGPENGTVFYDINNGQCIGNRIRTDRLLTLSRILQLDGI